MHIENCTIEDMDEIFRLYRIASDYQRSKKTVVVWPEFERSLVEREIAEQHQWKMVVEGKIACVWATTFSDEKIWGEKNNDPAVYIHRIATDPEHRGKSFVTLIADWAKQFAKNHKKNFVRLDTIGNNEKLIEYYKKSGFDFLGMFVLNDVAGLPPHYLEGPACLFEIKL